MGEREVEYRGGKKRENGVFFALVLEGKFL